MSFKCETALVARWRLRSLWMLCFAVALTAPGCGGSSGKKIDRQSISGSVTLDGAPLDQGTIRFEPMSDVKEKTAAGSLIQAGRYAISAAEGLPPGKYIVSISAVEGAASTPAADPQDAMNAAAKETPKADRIPAKYNKNSELVVEIKSGSNQHDFPLTSMPSK